ncbi:putative heat shock protein 70 [Trypanosoma rangeli]|uniref:Putative heat shock protein 70 n=1 Tax=Trypanosoma rangeli TaxID=5698 RepID=A0A422N0M8_TRYRA|nr:putative heat shock protein 70 [Trypanosoma rangeli]RNE99028.1 putative heat shock protein 70 [Trypanosoma rangeli]|eukprot:RNE99028.1 putative heat shock protein 70 [Trypanosoma rangeli]
MEEFDGAIGIDLGTTYSCVAIFRNDAVEVVPNDQGNRTTPSCVAFYNEEVLVGDSAKQLASRGVKGVVYDAKRMIGRRFSEKTVREDVRRWPFAIEEGENDRVLICVEHNGETLRLEPELISARVLAYLKTCAEQFIGMRVKKAVITVPAYFNDAQRERTKAAARIAKLEVLRIINEPTAAALCYGLGLGSGAGAQGTERSVNVLVFDFGGGTFDVSIITIDNGSFAVRSTAGDTHLGGQDVDAELLQHLLEDLKRRHGVDATTQPRMLAKLLARCEQAKRTLSHATMEEIVVDGVLANGEEYILTLSRAKLEELCSKIFARCMAVVRKAMKDAAMTPEDVEDIVLVGGSSRIPALRVMLQEMFKGKRLCSSVHPDEAVAIGAAVQASIIGTAAEQQSERTANVVLMDVVPLSIGVEVDDGKFDVIIRRNTTVPYRATKEYSTVEDNQEEVEVQVFEGERPLTRHNHKLGAFILDGISHAKKGEPTITVTFSVDADGILTVTASEELAKVQKTLVVENTERLSDAAVQRMLEVAQALSEKDAVTVAIMDATQRLTHGFAELEAALGAMPLPLSAKVQRRVAFLEHGKDWLARQLPTYTETQVLERKTAKIMKLLQKAMKTLRRESHAGSGDENGSDSSDGDDGDGDGGGGSQAREASAGRKRSRSNSASDRG